MRNLIITAISMLFFTAAAAQTSGGVTVSQSEVVKDAFESHLQHNASRHVQGYRIRIYFDSSQDARAVSGEIAERFSAMYPEVRVYRTYTSPFFKVTVGDFRTRDEAIFFSRELEGKFPSTFLVKEPINFPAVWSSRDSL